MQIEILKQNFDELQKIYGDKKLDAIYGAGEIKNPKICLVFMNPTGKNISSNKNWKGLKAPWISTKNIWKMLYELGFIKQDLYFKIKNQKAIDWNYSFSNKVYQTIKSNSIYITNLSKATQIDARPLKNEIFKKYIYIYFTKK